MQLLIDEKVVVEEEEALIERRLTFHHCVPSIRTDAGTPTCKKLKRITLLSTPRASAAKELKRGLTHFPSEDEGEAETAAAPGRQCTD